MPAKRLDLCSTSDVAPGSALKVEIDDLILAVFNIDGEFYVTDDTCTHGPGSLSEGYIEDALHGADQDLPGVRRRRQSDDRNLKPCVLWAPAQPGIARRLFAS
jgi:Rieske [2Fe-2S] domain